MGSQSGALVHIGRRLDPGGADRLWTDTHILRIEPVEAIVGNVARIFLREGYG